MSEQAVNNTVKTPSSGNKELGDFHSPSKKISEPKDPRPVPQGLGHCPSSEKAPASVTEPGHLGAHRGRGRPLSVVSLRPDEGVCLPTFLTHFLCVPVPRA